jgi:hypothetical protein
VPQQVGRLGEWIGRDGGVTSAGGHDGFTVPMPLLGDDQAADVRRHLVKLGRFTAVEAFPQKDNDKKRVFADAKLSTAVFTSVKEPAADARRTPAVAEEPSTAHIRRRQGTSRAPNNVAHRCPATPAAGTGFGRSPGTIPCAPASTCVGTGEIGLGAPPS